VDSTGFLNIDDEDITEAYKKMSNEVHPKDCNSEYANIAFGKLYRAYKLILNPEKNIEEDEFCASVEDEVIEESLDIFDLKCNGDQIS
jgi:DnaJ-class molecular chaperone